MAKAKESYKIPTSLTSNYLDMEIAIQKDAVGFRPMPVRVILFWIAGIFIWFYLTFNGGSIFRESPLWVKILFSLAWFALVFVLANRDAQQRMQIEYFPALMKYIVKANRTVHTRRTDDAGAFYGIVGIDSIDNSGLVHYSDGTYGYWYAVVGSASALIFDEDKDAIVTRVDNFYKKLQPDAQIEYVTVKTSQNVATQLAHLDAQQQALEFADPDVNNLFVEQYKLLRDEVGQKFRSIHQYMILKGDNREALSSLNSTLLSEVQNSSLMIKRCDPLYEEQILTILKSIYRGN